MNKRILTASWIILLVLILEVVFVSGEFSADYWDEKGQNPYTPDFWISLGDDYSSLTLENLRNINFLLSNFPWENFNASALGKFDFINLESKQTSAIFLDAMHVDLVIEGEVKEAIYNKSGMLNGNFGSFKPTDYPADKYRIEIVKIGEKEDLKIIPKTDKGILDTAKQIVFSGCSGCLFRLNEFGSIDVILGEEDVRISSFGNMRTVLSDGRTLNIENSGGSFTINNKGEINAEDANLHLEIFDKSGNKILNIKGSFKFKDDIVMLTKKGSLYDDLKLGLHFESNNEDYPEFAIVQAGISPDEWPFEDTNFWKKKGTNLVSLYGYAEVSEGFVSLQGTGYVEGEEGKIKINSMEPIKNPEDFGTNREFVYNYIHKGASALAGEPEDKKIETPLAILDLKNEYDFAFGKISLESREIKYGGLTSSVQYINSYDGELNKDVVSIDSAEDGRIARFEREIPISIVKKGEDVGIDMDAVGLVSNLDYLADRDLEITLGNKDRNSYLIINRDTGILYHPSYGNQVNILFPYAAGLENTPLTEAQKLIELSREKGGISYSSTKEAQRALSSLDSYIEKYKGIDEEKVIKARIKKAELIINYKLESYDEDWFEKLIEEYPEEEYKGTLQLGGIDLAENFILSKNTDYTRKFYRTVADINKDSEAGSEALDKLNKFTSIEAIQYAKLQATENFFRRISDIKGYKTVMDLGFFGEVLNNAKERFQNGEDGTKVISDLLTEIYGGAGPAALALREVRDERVKEAEYNLATALVALNMIEKTMESGANDFEEAFEILEDTAAKRGIKKVGNWEHSTVPDFSKSTVNIPPEKIQELFGAGKSILDKYPALKVTENDLHYLVYDDPYFSEFLKLIKSGDAGTEEEDKAWLEAAKKERLRGNLAAAVTISKNVGDSTSNPEIESEAYSLYSSSQGLGALQFMLAAKPEEVAKIIDNIVIDSFIVDYATSKILGMIGKAGSIDNVDDAYDAIKYADNLEDSNDIRQLAYGLCFVAGTKITLYNGKSKNIEDMKEGDIVLSYDIENKGLVPAKVVSESFEMETDELIIINNNIKTTPEHPFFAANIGNYVSAKDLNINDILIDLQGRNVSVKNIRTEKLKKKIKVYNFDVDDAYDNYFADGILAENSNPANPCVAVKDTTELVPIKKKYTGGGYTKTGKGSGLYEQLKSNFYDEMEDIVLEGIPGLKKDLPLSVYKGKRPLWFFEDAAKNYDYDIIPSGVIESADFNTVSNVLIADKELMKVSWGEVDTERIINVVRINKPKGGTELVAIDRRSVTLLSQYYKKMSDAHKQIISYNKKLAEINQFSREAREIRNRIRTLENWEKLHNPRLVIYDVGSEIIESTLPESVNGVREFLKTREGYLANPVPRNAAPRIFNVKEIMN